VFKKRLSFGSVDRSGQEAGPSTILSEGYEVAHVFVFFVRTVQLGSTDRRQVPNWIWAGTVCFGAFQLQTVRGFSLDSINSQGQTVRPCRADSPHMKINLVSALAI
jgi:hypothetical protein